MSKGRKMGQGLFRKIGAIAGQLVGATVMGYFAYHAVEGDRGLIALWNTRFEIERADRELAVVTAEKSAIEHRVKLLRPESLDRDMLEERARVMLGVIAPGELIIPVDPFAR